MSQKIKLKTDHTHAGMKFKAGADILVDDASAEWLLDNKVGEKAVAAFDKPALPSAAAPDTK